MSVVMIDGLSELNRNVERIANHLEAQVEILKQQLEMLSEADIRDARSQAVDDELQRLRIESEKLDQARIRAETTYYEEMVAEDCTGRA